MQTAQLQLRTGLPLRRQRGFTLAELVVVVLIISIVTAAAIPAFVDSLTYYRVELAARRVKADLELTRQTARLTSASQTLTFTGAIYSTGASIAALDDADDVYSVNLAVAPYEIGQVSADFEGEDFITFDGYGTPSSDGAVVLRGPTHQCTVTLDAATGEITIASVRIGS